MLVGITLVLIVVTEAGLRLSLTIKDRFIDRPRTEHPPAALAARSREEVRDLSAPALRSTDLNPEQTADFVAERSSPHRYIPRPYVHWRYPPFQGQYLNVSRDGLQSAARGYRRRAAGTHIHLRRLSYVGLRDHCTIPSHLSKLLHAQGYRAEVTNYGEIAYVSTQEVITQLRRIQRGEVPDIALFY